MYNKALAQEQPCVLRFSAVADRIIFRLEGPAGESRAPEKMPGRKKNGLTITYYILITEMAEGRITVPVSFRHLCDWGIGEEELYFWAMFNTPRFYPPTLRPIEHYLQGEEEFSSNMFILSNENGFYGAGCIFYPGILAQAAEVLRDDVWILPSSIHETILIPAGMSDDRDLLSAMVRDINKNYVALDEVLSDEVFFYDKKQNLLLP